MEDSSPRTLFENQAMRRMFELTHDLLAVAGVDDRYRLVNPTFTRLLGWSREEMLSHPGSFFVHPDDLERTAAELQGLAEGHPTVHFENRYRHKNGSYRWISWTAAPVPEEGLVYAVGRDVTHRRRVDAALRESEQRFRRLADAAPAILWLTEPDGACSFLSRGWYEYTGQTRDQALGFGWLEAVHPDDRERSSRVFAEAIEHRRAFSLDYRIRRLDDEHRWAIDAGRPRFGESGEFLGFVGTVIDIHDRKEAEEQLREVNRRKDEFLAMLSHELRNPLSSIRNATEVLKLTAGGDDRLDRVYRVLERQTVHMTRLIDGLLEVSRIARGKIGLSRRVLDLREVVEDVLHDRRIEIEGRGLELERQLPERLWVWGDRVRLVQVVDNLVGNAVKFTEAGGSIAVLLGQEDGQALLRVRDTGIGMRPEMIERLFEAFQQESQELARSAGGLGLGLALARSLVELHGGTVEAHSPGLGKGSELIVRLPLAADSPPTDDPPTDELEPVA